MMSEDNESLIKALKAAIEEKDILLELYRSDLRYKKSVLEKMDEIMFNCIDMVEYCLAHQKKEGEE